MARTHQTEPTKTFCREHIMGCIQRKPTENVVRSTRLSRRTAPALLGEHPNSSYDQALHGCDSECSAASQPWPDSSGHIRPAAVCFGKANPMEVATGVWWTKICCRLRRSSYWDGSTDDPRTLGDWLQGSGWVQALVRFRQRSLVPGQWTLSCGHFCQSNQEGTSG